MTLPRGEHRVRFGNYEARKRGARRIDLRDPYRLVVALTWPRFLFALLGAEFLLNVVFALLYLAEPGAIAKAHAGSLADAFFFSIETLATVGYGEMYPADLYGHLVSAAEIVTGVAFIAIVTGLIFVRVSRPKPCFHYADALVVARLEGRPTLMIRVASSQLGVLYDAEARLSVLLPTQTDDGNAVRGIVDLPLVRAGIPVFALSWTLMHVIDAASPLAGLDGPAIAKAGFRFFLMLQAEDATIATTVRDLRAYEPAQIHFGMRYADALSISDDGHPVLDLDRIGLLEPDVIQMPGGTRPATEICVSPSAVAGEGLKDSNVLVVGGTSHIGLASARQARSAGASVIVCGPDSAKAERVARENAFADWRAFDVTDREAAFAALANVPTIDHLVMLADPCLVGKVLDTGIIGLRRAFDERVWAVVHIVDALGLNLSSSASITLVSSKFADCLNRRGTAVLVAASAAMEVLACRLALELAPRRVNTVFLRTTGKLPQHGNGTADEVGAAVTFLMLNGSMSGETLHIDAGAPLV